MFQIPIVPVGTKPQRTPLHVEPSDPKQTLYIRNLNEQIDLEQMKLAIQSLFNPLDVKVKRNVRVRGQAFVSFASVELAKRAMELNGYLLFEKPIDIQWARQDSDTISKAKGTLETIKAARSSIFI
jgi:RNA recognition motif-containing protein